jgi:hypothetical protein
LTLRGRIPTLLSSIGRVPGVESVTEDGNGTIAYRTLDPSVANPAVVREAVAAGADVVGLREASATLEEVYLALMNGGSG